MNLPLADACARRGAEASAAVAGRNAARMPSSARTLTDRDESTGIYLRRQALGSETFRSPADRIADGIDMQENGQCRSRAAAKRAVDERKIWPPHETFTDT